MKFISGEKYQLLCNIMMGIDSDFNYNPLIKKLDNSKLFNINNIDNIINNDYKIFMYSCRLSNINLCLKVLSFFQNSFILILHNSDQNFEKKHLILFEKIPNLKKIYTQNMNVLDNRVIPLPIGIANSMWTHGNQNIINNVIEQNIKKTNSIYFNFNISTNRQGKRRDCYETFKDILPWINTFNYERYLKTLASYKFAFCPEGNGIDSHRFWECLYLKVIPICTKNILVNYYSKDFPIIILDKWSDLNINNLNYENYTWDNYYKLDMQYYIDLLNN